MTSGNDPMPSQRTRDRGGVFARLLRLQAEAAVPPLVMGVLNVTPDSFSDGGLFAEQSSAIAHGKAMVAAGAAIIDVGGESTRPQAEPVPAEEELRRVMPVIEALAGLDAAISIDTIKPEVAETALAAGAHIVNDVRGLREEAMAEVVARHGAGLVIMHNPGLLGSSSGTEGDPVEACLAYFAEALARADAAGISRDRIALDPGFGFGKSGAQNFALLARFAELAAAGQPLLAGTSRKSFIGRLIGREADQRLAATLATHVGAALSGAAIVRAHDVAEHVDAMRVVAAIRAAGK